jgi:hypothetical protein
VTYRALCTSALEFPNALHLCFSLLFKIITSASHIASVQEGVIPVPVFINGVEAHTVVRDLLTSSFEQQELATGRGAGLVSSTLSRDAVRIDALLSTIGFPLVQNHMLVQYQLLHASSLDSGSSSWIWCSPPHSVV